MQSTPSVRVVDPSLAREGGASRRVIDVAVAVLIRSDGSFLLTSRPAGKAYAGYWEFPGGKLELGESVAQALRRELQEELAIDIQAVHPWKVDVVDYPHALVRLHFCQVFEWTGDLQMRESQSFSWENFPVRVQPVLPGSIAALQWLSDERNGLGKNP